MKVSKNLVIIADDIDGDALTTLVVNKIRGTFSPVAIKAPGFGDRRKEMLEDIATLTGAVVISSETGKKLETTSLEDLGKCDKIIVSKDETVIIGGHGDKTKVEERILLIKKQFETSESVYDKEKLNERIAKLSGGVAVISVGANSETELKERKLRLEDALAATRAAVEEGIISGGFGSQRILNGKPRRPHLGMDIANKKGTPIKASASGTVTLAKKDLYFTGDTIGIEHGHGITSVYYHLNSINVVEGQKIIQGDIIGTMGSTGRATGDHLHFGIYWIKNPVDPELVLKN